MKAIKISAKPALLFVSALLLFVWLSCRANPRDEARPIEFAGRTMGTTYSVKVGREWGGDRELLAMEVARILESIDRQMSTYRPDSAIMRFNTATSTRWAATSPQLLEVIEQAKQLSLQTDGAFDITVGPLVNLWGFGSTNRSHGIPSDSAIELQRQRVGYRLLQVRSQPPSIRKTRPDVFVDLSSIAKGYAVDRVFAALLRAGVTDCLVEIGGELRGRGRNERGQAWVVAIENPPGPAQAPAYRIRLSEHAVATAGDYRNFFLGDGRKYAHVLDPRSGRPVEHGLASVTVVDSSATRADALATALMVLGPEEGCEFATNHGIAALFFFRRGERLVSRITGELESFLLEE